MINEVFKVKLISVRDCFLHFSFPVLQKITSNYSTSSVLKLTEDNVNNELYFSWAPQPFGGLDDNCLGISVVYANRLGLADNATVILSVCYRVPVVKTVCVLAATQDDYEMMEVSQNELQLSMLDQVRVVSVGQPVTVWFSKTLHCTIYIDSMDLSSKVGKLEQLTDIVISSSEVEASACSSVKNQISHTDVPVLDEPSRKFETDDDTNRLNLEDDSSCDYKLTEIMAKEKHSGIFRVVVLSDGSSSCCDNLHYGIKHPYNAFIDKTVLLSWSNKVIEQHSAVVCFLSLVPYKFDKELYRKNDSDSNICIRLYPIQDNCHCIPLVNQRNNCQNQPVYVSSVVKNIMRLRNGSKVKLKMYTPCLDTKLSHVELSFTNNLLMEEVESWFREALSKNANTLINNNAPMPVESCTGAVEYVTVSLWPSTISCWPFSSAELKTCDLSLSYEKDKETDKSDNENENDKQENEEDDCNDDIVSQQVGLNSFSSICHSSRTLGDVVKEGLISFELCLKLSSSLVSQQCTPVQMNNNVLCVGSGACILSDWLCNWLSGPPHSIYVTKIDCKSLKGKKGENIQKRLSEKLQKCIYYQPSLLVLLDLDAIAGSPSQPENKVEEIFLQGMGRMIRDTLLENQWNQSIGILATAQSTTSVNAEILGPQGYHLFPTLLQIPMLSQDDRVIVMKEIINKRLKSNNFSKINLEEFVTRTDGYSYEDLLLLADKAFFQAWQRKANDGKNEELSVTLGDLLAALDSYTPSHLHSINLYKSTDHSWNSVGGMKTLKESLTEIIIWPSKFKHVYEQCPLSSESGVLLYGVPGTGKTLLASALAGEAGLNFISIKGPELLSKYIGASEEAVRNVFEKAKKAKPCILFFDEFDSLAPRRGHDSSGVMDRVVNQLLTQMDGIEERTGVYIIAATSRPDLLDPALLRPGRIGHVLHCSLPNTHDRLEIMEVLSKRLVLDSDCDFPFIADETEGFSGADMQAVIYGAQMLAYDDMMVADKMSVEQEADDFTVHVKPDISNKLVVKNSHLLAALRDTNPSLRLEELRRYQRIYENFQRMRCKTNEGESLSVEVAQKVTLA